MSSEKASQPKNKFQLKKQMMKKQPVNKKSNMHIFSISYNSQQKLLALGIVNKEL